MALVATLRSVLVLVAEHTGVAVALSCEATMIIKSKSLSLGTTKSMGVQHSFFHYRSVLSSYRLWAFRIRYVFLPLGRNFIIKSIFLQSCGFRKNILFWNGDIVLEPEMPHSSLKVVVSSTIPFRLVFGLSFTYMCQLDRANMKVLDYFTYWYLRCSRPIRVLRYMLPKIIFGYVL